MNTTELEQIMRNKVNIFKENEKVLCKHDGLLYEVNIIQNES